MKEGVAHIAVGLIMALFLFAIALFTNSIRMLYLVFAFAIPLIVIGIASIAETRHAGTGEKNTKTRSTASVLSVIGLGHLYLGKKLKSFLFFTGFIIGATVLITGTIKLEDVGYPVDAANILFLYGLFMFTTVLMWSALDVNRLCNEMGLEIIDSYYEMDFERTDMILSALLIISFILFALTSVLMICYDVTPDRRINAAVLLASFLLPLYVFLNYRDKKRKGTWQQF